jgi:CcmD family protein
MRRFRVFALLLTLAFAPAASAQGPNTPVSSDAAAATAGFQAVAPAAESPGPAGAEAGTLAERGQPPRTMRAYWHVFIAFAVTWLLLFGYVISLGRRWARLEHEVLARQ